MLSFRKGKKTELETMRTYSAGMTSWQGSSPKQELSVPRGLMEDFPVTQQTCC